MSCICTVADNIMLISHIANVMRRTLAICDHFAADFDLKCNNTKSVAMRIGKRYGVQCAPFTLSGESSNVLIN